jgi:hypothetical protein
MALPSLLSQLRPWPNIKAEKERMAAGTINPVDRPLWLPAPLPPTAVVAVDDLWIQVAGAKSSADMSSFLLWEVSRGFYFAVKKRFKRLAEGNGRALADTQTWLDGEQPEDVAGNSKYFDAPQSAWPLGSY